MKRTLTFLLENSAFLILGTVVAVIWANTNPESYAHFLHTEIWHNPWVGAMHDGERVLNLHFLVNDIFMAFFFAIAGKEVWEATLPGGPLNSPKQAAAPLIATLGGVFGPVAVYLVIAAATGQFSDLANGWAVPTATDIAFSYLVARLIFGAAHPAIPFLLLLAIADDALGLAIIAIAYPQGEMALQWMALPAVAFVLGTIMRKKGVASFWPYILGCGAISWLGFHWANLHPALGLLPIIPTLPHAHRDQGLFAEMQDPHGHPDDTLNRFEHWFKNPVEIALGLFGLLNAGVGFTSVGAASFAVLGALLIGKPLGIWLMGALAGKLGFSMPEGMNSKDLWVVGCIAGIGFTVAIFVSGVAFPPGAVQDAAKIGALGSFGAAGLSFLFARILGVKKQLPHPEALPPVITGLGCPSLTHPGLLTEPTRPGVLRPGQRKAG